MSLAIRCVLSALKRPLLAKCFAARSMISPDQALLFRDVLIQAGAPMSTAL